MIPTDVIDRAVSSFEAGDYRAAVDAFEDAYHRVEGRARRPWLGLIRIAAALEHFHRGHPHAGRRLYESGREILAGVGPRFAGLDIDRLLREVAAAVAPLLAVEPERARETRPETRPALVRVRE